MTFMKFFKSEQHRKADAAPSSQPSQDMRRLVIELKEYGFKIDEEKWEKRGYPDDRLPIVNCHTVTWGYGNSVIWCNTSDLKSSLKVRKLENMQEVKESKAEEDTSTALAITAF